MNIINLDEYQDKVAGCWAGKNIGGTLGDPFEGQEEVNDVVFYVQELYGSPVPNDDLDLQLIWLHAIKDYGLNNITAQLLGEYWLGHINGPWSEYGTCKKNMCAGLMPPLSGSCNNERWKYSNGAWIRSEIWACCFPGEPDKAIKYAYIDGCIDHYGEGIYAELFTAALESAAFIVDDIRELIKIGLSKVPADSRIARSANIVINAYENGTDWLAVRNALVEDSNDLGWFQAPANIGFVVLGLLYGQGDFGKSICLAVNCGDDTDCTGATVGAVLGIMGGYKAIPDKWIEPIGDSIVTKCLNCFLQLPKTLSELTEQIVDITKAYKISYSSEIQLLAEKTSISDELIRELSSGKIAGELWSLSPYELTFELPYAQLIVNYMDGPCITCGKEKKIEITVNYKLYAYEQSVLLNWRLPEGWDIKPGKKSCYYLGPGLATPQLEYSLVPGTLDGGFQYVELEVRDSRRMTSSVLQIPFQCEGTVRTSFDK